MRAVLVYPTKGYDNSSKPFTGDARRRKLLMAVLWKEHGGYPPLNCPPVRGFYDAFTVWNQCYFKVGLGLGLLQGRFGVVARKG